MKNLELRSVLLCCLVCGLWCILGCQKGGGAAAGGDVRRAQIVGNENIQLKKTIAEKDSEIAGLNQQLEAAEAENERIAQQHADIYEGLMRHLLECSTKLEIYEKEN